MPTRAKLAALAHDLRNARTRRLPMDIAERAQHLTVRIERLLAATALDPTAADALCRQARELLEECEALLPKP